MAGEPALAGSGSAAVERRAVEESFKEKSDNIRVNYPTKPKEGLDGAP